jgi:hypothetical protein
MSHSCVRARAVTGACVALSAPLPALARSAFDTYGFSYRSFAMPATGTGSFRLAGDVLPDGRIIAVTGSTIFVETAPGSGHVEPAATLDASLVTGTDPSFIRVSPGGRIALGAGFGRPVVIFDSSQLGAPGAPSTISTSNALAFDVPHYDAAWADATHLAITAGAFGSAAYVSLLDTASSPAGPDNPRIIDHIGGASAGIAFDGAGRLFTGNGFDAAPGGSGTGWIKAFSPGDWAGGAANFETAGLFVGEALSAGTLGFDTEGNLFVGGGDVAQGDLGYLGVINAVALAGVLGGAGPIDPANPAVMRRLDPLGTGGALYDGVYNPVTGELYAAVTDFVTGGNTWYATIPAPTSGGALALGILASRRRRRA